MAYANYSLNYYSTAIKSLPQERIPEHEEEEIPTFYACSTGAGQLLIADTLIPVAYRSAIVMRRSSNLYVDSEKSRSWLSFLAFAMASRTSSQ